MSDLGFLDRLIEDSGLTASDLMFDSAAQPPCEVLVDGSKRTSGNGANGTGDILSASLAQSGLVKVEGQKWEDTDDLLESILTGNGVVVDRNDLTLDGLDVDLVSDTSSDSGCSNQMEPKQQIVQVTKNVFSKR